MKLYELTILEVQTQVTRDSAVPSTLNMLEISHKIKKKKSHQTRTLLCSPVLSIYTTHYFIYIYRRSDMQSLWRHSFSWQLLQFLLDPVW